MTTSFRGFRQVVKFWGKNSRMARKACNTKGSGVRCQSSTASRPPVARPSSPSAKEPLIHSAARLAVSFPPRISCRFLDLWSINLRNLQERASKKPLAMRPPHFFSVSLNKIIRSSDTPGCSGLFRFGRSTLIVTISLPVR